MTSLPHTPSPAAYPLTDAALTGPTKDADALYAAFVAWAEGQGLTLYPHQDEAIIEVLSGAHVVTG